MGLFPRFSSKQTDSDNHKSKHQVQSIIEAPNSETSHNGNKGINVSTDTIPEVDISDLVDLSSDAVHHDAHDNPSLHEDLFQNSIRNEMLTHYNRIVIGCFKDFFQSIDKNNLAEVLQALKELNFMLANRAPELAAHYNIVLEPHQISAVEVPDLVKAHLHCNAGYNLEYSVRGRPYSKGNQYHQYNWQSSLLLRYNQQSQRSDAHFHSNRNYTNTHHHINSQSNSPRTVRNAPNTSNNQVNTITTLSPNNSNLIGSLQSKILGLQTQALQQSMLNSIKIFTAPTKVNSHHGHRMWKMPLGYATWTHLAMHCPNYRDLHLKLASYLESKEVSSGRQLDWHSWKKHLTGNYSEILYDTHAINAYDSLHQGSDESTIAYLHRVQDILEHIHLTSNMSSITAIGTNHAKILTGLKDSQLQNKLAESKAKKMDYHGPGPTLCSRYGHWLWKVMWVFTPNLRCSICFIHKF